MLGLQRCQNCSGRLEFLFSYMALDDWARYVYRCPGCASRYEFKNDDLTDSIRASSAGRRSRRAKPEARPRS